jgi:uncharacterized protein with HEPN domain
MKRDVLFYLEDIFDAIKKIELFMKDKDINDLIKNDML